jgi:septum formation protein
MVKTEQPTPPQITNKRVILASNSPRRRELLHEIIAEFNIAPSRDVDESYPADLSAEKVAEYISHKKSQAYADMVDNNTMLLTADTVVLCNGRIMGKPKDADEAAQMLRELSGCEHSVTTGFTLRTSSEVLSATEETKVTFATLTDNEIHEYVQRYKPYDKAGAYGIQEWIGCMGIVSIHGCYYNVMGLPLHRLYQAIKAMR